MKYLLLSFLLLTACHDKQTYREMVRNGKYQVGDVVLVDEGFYAGCHLKVEDIIVTDGVFWGHKVYYKGTSNDCPIGYVESGHAR